MNDLKTKLFDITTGRWNQNDEAADLGSFGWVVDFSPDNVINTALRKEELMDFALFNEGNVYNKLFYKVRQNYCVDLVDLLHNTPSIFKHLIE